MPASSLLRTVLCAGALALAGSLTAQQAPQIAFPVASPPATLKQRVGITDIEVTYARPSMKGRKIFGGLVPYGQVWRTGADKATKISFSTAVKLNGTDIPAGTYELHTIPGETEWTVIIHKDMGQWGSYTYDQKNDVARIAARPVAVPSAVETFSIGVSGIKNDSATLYLLWENTRVPVALKTDLVGMLQPQIEAVMTSAAEKKPYMQAAMFYYENNLDLDKALAWMDAGLAGQPNAFWMIYRKGLILAKKGDKAGALAAAQRSIELASKDERVSLRDEYVRLNNALIASLK